MALNLADLTRGVDWRRTERSRDLYPVPAQPLDNSTTQKNTPRGPEEQSVAIVNRAEISDYYKAFLDASLKHNAESLKQIAASGDEVPIGPIVNCSLRARGTGAQLRDLALRPYALPHHEGRWRLTNRHDSNAPVVVTIDLVDVPNNAPSNMVFIGPGLPITIESRPTPKRTVRNLLDLHTFLQALQSSQVVEVVDEKTSQVRVTGYGVQIKGLDPAEERLIDALRTIQSTFFMTTFPVPTTLTPDDRREALRIAEILRTGQTVIQISNISAEMNTETITNLLRYADKNGVLQHVDENGITQPESMHIEQETTIHTLFGAPLDLGPSRADYPPMKLARSAKALRKELARSFPKGIITVALVPADAQNNKVYHQYKRYARRQNDESSTQSVHNQTSNTAPASSEEERPRIAGLNRGAFWVSEDFDEPLPDEFWLGAN